jgi:hypothetical protein
MNEGNPETQRISLAIDAAHRDHVTKVGGCQVNRAGCASVCCFPCLKEVRYFVLCAWASSLQRRSA